jgi:DNA-binding XRE family transcriptional regulator
MTQEKPAEKIDVSTHHIGMIELTRNFPALDFVERIANAPDIEIYQLFMEPHSPNEELEQLRQEIRGDMKQPLDEYFKKTSALTPSPRQGIAPHKPPPIAIAPIKPLLPAYAFAGPPYGCCLRGNFKRPGGFSRQAFIVCEGYIPRRTAGPALGRGC